MLVSSVRPGAHIRIQSIMTDSLHEQDEPILDTSAEVSCPHCGETVAIALDSGGGALQDYVEDCYVCCRPWRVRVHYDATGTAQVSVEPAE